MKSEQSSTIYLSASEVSAILGQILARAISPPPDTTVSQWADLHRWLSGKAASEPGQWRTERAPYTAEVMDAFSDPAVEKVVCMWASQLAKTEIILNVCGYFIDVDPSPIVIAQPTLNLARYFSRARLAPMIKDSAPLAALIAEPKGRDSENTTLSKGFRGGQLDIVSAQSAADLSARPARVALADEVDRYEATSEGDPLDLLDARTSNFAFRKVGYFSSPRDKDSSRVEAAYQDSDRRKWWVPCPHCGEHQILMWANVRWDSAQDADGNEVLDENGEALHLPETARYYCQHCGGQWSEAQRQAAIANGHWRSERPFAGVAGFWLNALNSPWQTLPRLVKKFLAARDVPGRLRTFVNTVLGETWEESGAQVDDDALVRRAERALYVVGEVPAGVLVLIGSVDVQGDRLEVEIRGWGRGYENWQVRHLVLAGDPGRPELWEDLDTLLAESWQTEDGRLLPLRAVGLDSGGHHTELVLRFCRARWGRRVWALKGDSKGLHNRVWPLKFSHSRKNAHRFWNVNVDAAKKARPGLLPLPQGHHGGVLQAVPRRNPGDPLQARLPGAGVGETQQPAQRGPGLVRLQLRGAVRPGGHGAELGARGPAGDPGASPGGAGGAGHLPGRAPRGGPSILRARARASGCDPAGGPLFVTAAQAATNFVGFEVALMPERSELQARLGEAQAAYHRLLTGALEASVGSGDTQVTFSRTSVADLRAYITDLERQIATAQGLGRGGCRRLEIYF
ncbi:MAG: phage terminase large subunit family protein [Desulfarculus sp.]|nr:phage terminase large subunit family protein [Desulfarculus sp.]